jgi:hypothetical protein
MRPAMLSARAVHNQHGALFSFVWGDLDAVAKYCDLPQAATLESLVFVGTSGELAAARPHHPAILIVHCDLVPEVPKHDYGSCYFSVTCISSAMSALARYFDRV